MRHKFNAVRTEVDGIKFPSKLEAAYFKSLKIMQKAGSVLFFLRQVPFDLPGGVRYFADFVVFNSDGTCNVVECKGVDLPMGKLKRKQIEDLYPIKIEVITKV